MAKLTKVQQTVLDILLTKQDARIRGSYQSRKWAVVYTEGGFTPTQKITEPTVNRLFIDGYITLGQAVSAGDSGLTIFTLTASRIADAKKKVEDSTGEDSEDEQD